MLRKILFGLLLLSSSVVFAQSETAIFAGGCFWCMQADFDKLTGVINTTVGYDGGQSQNPTYQLVESGTTHYVESVAVTFDPKIVSYQQVLDYYWHHIDPTVKDAQFCDVGSQYRTVIFYLNSTQQQQAQVSLDQIKKQFNTVYTEILPTTMFYPAEDYHQKYYQKNPAHYEFYRFTCGRDARVAEVWKGKL